MGSMRLLLWFEPSAFPLGRAPDPVAKKKRPPRRRPENPGKYAPPGQRPGAGTTGRPKATARPTSEGARAADRTKALTRLAGGEGGPVRGPGAQAGGSRASRPSAQAGGSRARRKSSALAI